MRAQAAKVRREYLRFIIFRPDPEVYPEEGLVPGEQSYMAPKNTSALKKRQNNLQEKSP